MRVRYYAQYATLGGYGRAARDYLAALHDHTDVELEIVSLDRERQSPEPRYSRLDPLVIGPGDIVGTTDVAIYHAPPRVLETLAREGWITGPSGPAATVALTTWETSWMPDIYRDVLWQYFDAVITPSTFCQQQIFARTSECDPDMPVIAVPHCFDPGWWEPVGEVPLEGRRFRFYTHGAAGERKNVAGVIKAYLHEFTRQDDVELLVVYGAGTPETELDEVRSLVARARLESLPRMAVPEPRALSEDDLLDLHRAADCFVSATRGEGWGLGMFEAACLGKAVIAPSWGGQGDFLDGYPRYDGVMYTMTPCFGSEIRGSRDDAGVRVSIPPGVNARQLWADPDLCGLAYKMRQVYEELKAQDYQPPSEAARAFMTSRFRYSVVGPALAKILEGLR